MSTVAGRTIVVGGGVVGAMCAYHLARAGERVTIVDRGTFGSGCSHGNCGLICPSHVLPLAAPGAISTTLRAMLRRGSPFYIKPRLSPTLWRWLWGFARRCNRADMLEAGHAIDALLRSSMELYRGLVERENLACEWEERGTLFVFLSEHELDHFGASVQLLREEFGVDATRYAADDLVRLEPALRPTVAGAWHFACDTHLRPDRLMSELRRVLNQQGVEFIEGCQVTGITSAASHAQALRTSLGELHGERFIFATGAWTPMLNDVLGCRIPIQPGKGYSITMPRPALCPKIPLLLEEHRVAVTPMQSGYRLGSTMEFAGYDSSINPRRLALLKDGARHYMVEPYCEPVQEEWFGWRPMTTDGKPFIDRSPSLANVWIAAGHNMLGVSMAPATGRLVAELVLGQAPHIDPGPYAIGR